MHKIKFTECGEFHEPHWYCSESRPAPFPLNRKTRANYSLHRSMHFTRHYGAKQKL